jgi:CHAD domain-containing protein
MAKLREFPGVVRETLQQVRLNLHDAAAGDVEAIHQARVALRRLRVAVDLSENGAADDTLRAPIKRTARALGDARDWDVLVEETLPQLNLDPSSLAALVERANTARQGAHRRARHEINRRAFRRALPRLEKIAPLLTPSPDAAADWIDRRWKKLRRRGGKHLETRREKKLHAARIELKKLRYGLDATQIQPPADFEAKLRHLQKRIGKVNDLRVAHALLQALLADSAKPTRRVVRHATRQLDDDLKERRKRLRKPWHALRGSQPDFR